MSPENCTRVAFRVHTRFVSVGVIRQVGTTYERRLTLKNFLSILLYGEQPWAKTRVPPWAWHEHASEGQNGAILISVQDTPVMKALGLYREQAYEKGSGYQDIRIL